LNFEPDSAAASASAASAAAASATNAAAASATNKDAADQVVAESSAAASATNQDGDEELAADKAAFETDDAVDDEADVLELARHMQLASLVTVSQGFFACRTKEAPKDVIAKIPGWKTKGQDRGLVRLKGTQLCAGVVQCGVKYWAKYIGLPPVMTGAHARHAHKTWTQNIHNKICTQYTQQDMHTRHVHKICAQNIYIKTCAQDMYTKYTQYMHHTCTQVCFV
jgi:hypothetical protein